MTILKLNQTYLGIDIGSQNIKGIKIKKSIQGFKIVEMGSVEIPKGAIKQGLFFDQNVAINLIRELQSQLKAGNLGAYIGFSGQHAIIREIELPVMTEKELHEAIFWEAEKVLPYSVEEAIIDWIILERKRETDQMMSILLVAGRQDYIQSFLKPFKAVGIKPLNLSIFPIAMIHLLQHIPSFNQQSITAIIDMGAEVTHLLIAKEGTPWLSRTIPTGGKDYTEAVVQSFGIDFEEAESAKREHGGLDSQEVDFNKLDLMTNPFLGIEEILYGVAQDVMSEIRRSFVHFQLHNRGQEIQQIYLVGGSALLPGMAKHLQQFMNISVTLLNLADYFQYGKELEQVIAQDGILFAEALGLALSEV